MSKTKERKKRLLAKGKFKYEFPYNGSIEIKKEINSLKIEFTHIECNGKTIIICADEPYNHVEEILLRNIIDKYDGS